MDEVVGRLAKFQAASDDEGFSETLYIDGELLERWLLKTVVNFGAAGWMGPKKLTPSPGVVSAIFGHTPLPFGIGLYSVDGIDANHRPSGGVTMRPFFRDLPMGRELVGAYVAVHGLGLLACLDDTLALQIDGGNASNLFGGLQSEAPRLLYHPGAIVMDRKRGEPLIVGMAWGGLFRFKDGTTATLAQAQAGSSA
ncbi:hypothetical protein [Xanthomonas arboricola]|uniref:hypothetical protein n=1 Tax=Xanthomonas arboricola TaxID=56448 RepID=UPI0011B06A2D|nr:hypothetical protein [Xanthomonas arboricola]